MTTLEDFYKLNKFVKFTADVIFNNVNLFMITSSSKIKFINDENIPIQTAVQLSKSLNKMINLYGRGGLIICVILMEI